jgi:malonyl-CoA O-methyltransferase
MIDKSLINLRFTRAAPGYHLHSPVQQAMAGDVLKAIKAYYQDKPVPENCLDIGCGTGILTDGLLELFPQIRIVGLDASEGMVCEYNKRFSPDRAMAVTADAETWICDTEYDLIVSNAAFQWFNEPQKAILKYSKFLLPKGLMALSLFGSGTFRELLESFRAAASLRGMDYADPRSASLLTVSDLEDTGKRSGLNFLSESLIRPVRYASVRDFFSALRSLGATAGDPEGIRKNMPIVRDAVKELEKKREPNGGIIMTYECLNYYARSRNKIVK